MMNKLSNVALGGAVAPTQHPARRVRVDLVEAFGWRKLKAGPATIWFAGHLYGDGHEQLLRAVRSGDLSVVAGLLESLDGNFALVVETAEGVLAATDRVASIPLFFVETDEGSA